MKKLLVAAAIPAVAFAGMAVTAPAAQATLGCVEHVYNGSLTPSYTVTCKKKPVRSFKAVVICWPGFKQNGNWAQRGETSKANCPFTSITDHWFDVIYDK